MPVLPVTLSNAPFSSEAMSLIRIARISPRTGKVVGWIDLSGILSAMYRTDPGAIPNGIAYDPVHKRLFVTGKLWPRLFEIRLVPRRTD